MTNEADACVIFKNSIIASGGLCWKIPDPSNMYSQTSQRPFDQFGTFRGAPLYAEVKYLNALKSFDLQRIEDHQIENLCNLKKQIPSSHCWIVLAVKAGRGDNRFFIFDDPEDIRCRRIDHVNYFKKELEKLPYYPSKKGIIDLTNYRGEQSNGNV